MPTLTRPELVLTATETSSLLSSATGIETITIGGRTFLYVAAEGVDRINIFEMFSDGTVTSLGSVADTTTLSLNGVTGFASVTLGGVTYLYAMSEFDDSVTAFRVQNDGSLVVLQTIVDNATLEINQPFGEMTVAAVGNTRFLIVHGSFDDGLSVFRIDVDGTLINTANVDDAEALGLGLNGVTDTATIQMAGRTFVFATGAVDSAITVFELTDTGQLLLRSSIADGGSLELFGASAVEAVTIGGQTFLYVTGRSDDGISVFQVLNSGTLVNIFNYPNDQNGPLNDPNDIEIFSFNGSQYAAVTSIVSDSISYYRIGTDGSLTLVDDVRDSENPLLALNGATHVESVEIDGQTFLIATGPLDNGFSIFQVGVSADPITGTPDMDVLIGTNLADTIDGGGGDDVIVGNDGNDRINGDQGDDIINGGDGDDIIRGDGDLTQTASDVVRVVQTGQDLALSITLPDASNSSTIEITGLINRQPRDTADFNIVYVIDISGSMGLQFEGSETVGDLNGDGLFNTLLDGTIAAFQSLNESIVNGGFGSADVSIVVFDDVAMSVYDGTAFSGVNGALSGLRLGGGTNFETALQEAIRRLNADGPGENYVFFMSDGDNNTGGSFLDEVATLLDPNGLDAVIRSIGLGTQANLAQLDLLDDGIANNSAQRVLLPSSLTTGLIEAPVVTTEIERLEIYVNGVLVRTLTNTEFLQTPLGLQYNVTVSDLSTVAGDLIEVVLVASDTLETSVAVSLTVPNATLDVGDDILIGGNGNDAIEGNGGNDRLFGDAGNDGLSGGTGDDTLDGGAGNDALIGGTGNDVLIGGDGIDTLQGGLGNDTYYIDRRDVVDESGGGAGDFDVLTAAFSLNLGALDPTRFLGSFEGITLQGFADLTATGNGANNLLIGNAGDNTLFGQAGDDTLNGGAGNDVIFAGAGNDDGHGGAGNDLILGFTGNDRLFGEQGNDTLRGEDGNDALFGGFGNDQLEGGAGRDFLAGFEGNDRLFGNADNDILNGGNGNDFMDGGTGNDQLFGGNGNDRLFGFSGNDFLLGQVGNDTILGGAGDDQILGGAGFDLIDGGTGNDRLTGNVDADVFVFANGHGRDTITDFDAINPSERMDFRQLSSLNSVSDVLAASSTTAQGVLINTGNGNSILLNGVTLAQLDASDFIF